MSLDGPSNSTTEPKSEAVADPSLEAEPLTPSMLGKFFGVPLLIVAFIVGGAISVVLLFGATSAPPTRTIDQLLTSLEASSGQRQMGMLLTPEKELWQTGLELSTRLQNQQFSEQELDSLATRLSAIVTKDLAALNTAQEEQSKGIPGLTGPNRLVFLISALGQTKQPKAIDPLIQAVETGRLIVKEGREPLAEAAIRQLAEFGELPECRKAIDTLVTTLEKPVSTETRLTAATALSVIAEPDDQHVIDALEDVLHSEEGELVWTAALSLARLESSAGKSMLLDLLDRTFWSTGDRYRVTDKSGTVHRYAMPPARIDAYLGGAIDAASNLADADIWEAIEQLKSDRSLPVRSRATEAIKQRIDT